MNIVILAAGQGKRMHSNLPKVLHPLAGKALAQHVIDTARSLQPEKLVVVFGHGGEVVRSTLNSADISWALQEPQLGTGHAVAQALPMLSGEGQTLVLYGDVPLTKASSLRLLLQAGRDGLSILTVDLVNPTGYGRIVRDASGNVQRIVEEKDATPEEKAIREVNSGIMAIPSARLADWLGRLSNDNAQGEYYLTDIVGLAVAEGLPVRTAQPDGEWEVLGVNSKVQLAELERVHQRNIADAMLVGGVRLADPARIDVRGELSYGRDVFIDVGCVFEGKVELADAVEVGPYCVLKNVNVGTGTRIAPFCHIEDALIGPDGEIGPYARLRPGTELGPEVRIGNFVEIKKSTVAAQSKVNHLAYIGDAEIGQRVNVGAGTITCNYDGANKYKTIIEDDVFIGSDSQLVAPVTVGRGATLGAGTTLTKDAPPGAFDRITRQAGDVDWLGTAAENQKVMDFWFLAFLFAVALLVAVGASLLLVGYVGTLPASFAFGWRNWIPTLILPVAGPLWFSATHWKDFSQPGKQLIFGLLLIGAALTLLYGAGPHFVDRLAAGVK